MASRGQRGTPQERHEACIPGTCQCPSQRTVRNRERTPARSTAGERESGRTAAAAAGGADSKTGPG